MSFCQVLCSPYKEVSLDKLDQRHLRCDALHRPFANQLVTAGAERLLELEPNTRSCTPPTPSATVESRPKGALLGTRGRLRKGVSGRPREGLRVERGSRCGHGAEDPPDPAEAQAAAHAAATPPSEAAIARPVAGRRRRGEKERPSPSKAIRR